MGGGDLNSKKSWHPNTMKNQERVWKAEQAATEEKKRIMELQRERAEERDRAELNNIIKQNSQANMDDRLHWMYDKPDKKVQQEEYLLGKSLDKHSEHLDKPDADSIPAVARRVVGSSMLSTAGDSQVDLVRKMREDPLLLIKERERAARAALLNNPLQRRKIAELLRKEKEQKKESKSTKNDKKQNKDLDSVLAAKLNALGSEKGINLAALLDSDESSSDSSSSSDNKTKKKKKKKKQEKSKKSKKNKKKKKYSSDSEVDSSDDMKSHEKSEKRSNREFSPNRSKKNKSTNLKRHSSYDRHTDNDIKSKRNRRDESPERHYDHRRRLPDSPDRSRGEHSRRTSPSRDKYVPNNKKRDVLNEEERAAKLAAMMAAGAEREVERGRRVAQQREADEHAQARPSRAMHHNEARSLPESLESRIHSNRHYIQRNSRHMNEHFARR